ncbi:MAG: transposase [Candidatus Alcyoniella australis]|nr:transposase [Candidatus Alcyoniella australis]
MATNTSSSTNRNRRRPKMGGDTHFITIKIQDKHPVFQEKKAVQSLRECIRKVQSRYPFEVEALVTMPDHLHLILTLPQDDDVLNLRVQAIQTAFAKTYGRNLDLGKDSPDSSRVRQSTIWRRRYCNHLICDDADLAKHIEYVFWNPVKHGLVKNPSSWPYCNMSRKSRNGHTNNGKICKMPAWISSADWD